MAARLALDTNAYRALDDGNVALAQHVNTSPEIAIPVVVLGELYYGLFLGTKTQQNLANLNRFLELSRVEILHITPATAKLFGEIAGSLKRVGRPIQQDDIWIAALCKQYDYTLATANQGFDAVPGLELVRF